MDAHTLKIKHGSLDPNWRTPPKMAERLGEIFPISIDLAADRQSAIVQNFLGPGAGEGLEDALRVEWHSVSYSRVGFLNPPYSVAAIKELKAQRAKWTSDSELTQAQFDAKIRALRVESWAEKAYLESMLGFTTVAVMPYAPQTKWFRHFVMGHIEAEPEPGYNHIVWSGHAALDYWRLPHRVTFLRPDGTQAANANVNTCIVIWGPNPGFVGPWVPSGRYWSYR